MSFHTPKVTVVIPSYNRYTYLLKAIESVLDQTYDNIELIIVDDCSTQKEYISDLSAKIIEYQDKFKNKTIKCLRLDKNSRSIFGYPCTAFVRNAGIQNRSKDSEYVAFLDDDDLWFPEKIAKQIEALNTSKEDVKMCCTDGYSRNNQGLKMIYNREMCRAAVEGVFNINLDQDSIPCIWDLSVLLKHNLAITSSMMISASLLDLVQGFKNIPNPCAEDFDCWKRCLEHTKLVYVDEPLFVYDLDHGDGRNW